MPDTSWPWNILTPYVGGPQTPPSPPGVLEQTLHLPQFGMTGGALQQIRNQAQETARTQTWLGDAGALLGEAFMPEKLAILHPMLDYLSNRYALTEGQRADNIYNRALSDTINNTLTAQALAQSQNSGGGILRGFL